MSAQAAPLVEVEGLRKYFPIREGLVMPRVVGQVRAVEDVSFTIRRGQVLALVGESGSGKSTAGRALLRLIEPSAGRIRFDALGNRRQGVALYAVESGPGGRPRALVRGWLGEP